LWIEQKAFLFRFLPDHSPFIQQVAEMVFSLLIDKTEHLFYPDIGTLPSE